MTGTSKIETLYSKLGVEIRRVNGVVEASQVCADGKRRIGFAMTDSEYSAMINDLYRKLK